MTIWSVLKLPKIAWPSPFNVRIPWSVTIVRPIWSPLPPNQEFVCFYRQTLLRLGIQTYCIEESLSFPLNSPTFIVIWYSVKSSFALQKDFAPLIYLFSFGKQKLLLTTGTYNVNRLWWSHTLQQFHICHKSLLHSGQSSSLCHLNQIPWLLPG